MFNHEKIFSGLINNDNNVIDFLIHFISPEIKEKVNLWFDGEYLLDRITNEFVKMRFIRLKAELRRDMKFKNEISEKDVSDFCQKDFYDNLYQVEIVFERLLRKGEKQVRGQFFLNPPPRDKEEIIKDICSVGLAAFYKNIHKNPEDPEICNLKVYHAILKNKTITYINKNYKIGEKNNDSEIKDAGDETKKYKITESIDDYNNQYIKIEDGDKNIVNRKETIFFLSEVFGDILNEDDLEKIAETAEDYLIRMKIKKIGEICIKIILFIYYGFDHDEIRERVLNHKGEKFTKDGFKVRLNRCRDSIKKFCGNFE